MTSATLTTYEKVNNHVAENKTSVTNAIAAIALQEGISTAAARQRYYAAKKKTTEKVVSEAAKKAAKPHRRRRSGITGAVTRMEMNKVIFVLRHTDSASLDEIRAFLEASNKRTKFVLRYMKDNDILVETTSKLEFSKKVKMTLNRYSLNPSVRNALEVLA